MVSKEEGRRRRKGNLSKVFRTRGFLTCFFFVLNCFFFFFFLFFSFFFFIGHFLLCPIPTGMGPLLTGSFLLLFLFLFLPIIHQFPSYKIDVMQDFFTKKKVLFFLPPVILVKMLFWVVGQGFFFAHFLFPLTSTSYWS